MCLDASPSHLSVEASPPSHLSVHSAPVVPCSRNRVTVRIDGKPITVAGSTTIMETNWCVLAAMAVLG